MFENINRKRAIQVLVLVMIVSAILAGVIFIVQFGASGFSIFSSDSFNNSKVNEEKTSSMDGIRTLTVKSNSESINIIPDSSSEVRAHFYGSFTSSDKTFKPKLVVEKIGDSLVIRIDDESKVLTLTMISNLKLDVYVPESFDKQLNISCTSGEVTSGEMKLDTMKVTTTSGRISVKAIDAANAVFRSTSGEIDAEGNYSDLDIDSTSGTISSKNINADKADINTTSGEIDLKGSLDGITAGSTSGSVIIDTVRLTKDMAIATTSGEIRIKLPADAEFSIGAKSLSGEINCAFPVTVKGSNTPNSLNGTVGSGKFNVSLSTTSGTISVSK